MNNQVVKNFINNPPKLLKPLINNSISLLKKLADYSINNPSGFLKNTAATSFSLGSVGLIAGLLMNKEVPEKEKRFMICQEAVEGVLDFGVFIFVASKFEQFGKYIVKKGFFLPGLENLSKQETKTHVKNFFKNPQSLPPNIESQISAHLNCTKIATSFIGTLVAFNIISPILRNIAASKIDKLFDKDKNKSKSDKTLNKIVSDDINPKDPFISFKKTMTSYKQYSNPYSTGTLKI